MRGPSRCRASAHRARRPAPTVRPDPGTTRIRRAAIALAWALAACTPPAAAQTEAPDEWTIENQTIAVWENLVVNVRPPFHVSNWEPLRYSASTGNAALATTRIDGFGRLTLRGRRRGVTPVRVTVTDEDHQRFRQSFVLTVDGPALVPLFPSAADPVREGFLRIVNHGPTAGEIAIAATDDHGMAARTVTLALDGNAVAQFNSKDLEQGNADKGLTGRTGPGQGDWRLLLESDLDFEVLSYVRTGDGFLTPMHDVIRPVDRRYRVSMFNPGSNQDQVSLLRLVNMARDYVGAWVRATDDAGEKADRGVVIDVAPFESRTVSASELESGAGVIGKLGDGTGKWRLNMTLEYPLVAMNLLESPTGHLTNLSTFPPVTPPGADTVYSAWYFPAAGDSYGRQGIVRVVNRSPVAGSVLIIPRDDSGAEYGRLVLSVGAGAAVQLNSDDLELGNAAKGLRGSTGAGNGAWRLTFYSALDMEVLAFVRTPDGFLTSMHDVAPTIVSEQWVPTFNPGSNPDQVSVLRIVNPHSRPATVTVAGTDDAGGMPETAVTLAIPGGMARTVTAADLEAGAEAVAGALGEGAGKWRLRVTSDLPVVAMSLLSSPTGHLTNLSTAPDRSGL